MGWFIAGVFAVILVFGYFGLPILWWTIAAALLGWYLSVIAEFGPVTNVVLASAFRCRCVDFECPAAAPRGHLESHPRHLPPHPAGHVADREGSDRRRHGVVGRGSLLRQARLGQAARHARAAPLGRGAGVPRRPGRGAVRDAERLGNHARAPGPARARVAVHQGQGLPRHDHPEAVRRPRLQRARALGGGDEALDALEHRGDLGDGAELARAGRAAHALRHRAAEEPLPAAPRERARSPLLRAHQPRGRLGRRRDPRLRHRLQGHLAGTRSARHARHLGQALHHLGTRGDAARPGFPSLRPRKTPRRKSGSGHHLRARSRPTPRA